MSSGSRGNFTAPGIKPDPFPSLAVYTAPETEANEQINNKSPESGARRGFSASPDPLHAPRCHLAPSCAPWLLLHPKSPWQGRRGRGTGMGTPSPGPGLTLLARTVATPRPVTSGYGDGPFFFFFFIWCLFFLLPARKPWRYRSQRLPLRPSGPELSALQQQQQNLLKQVVLAPKRCR